MFKELSRVRQVIEIEYLKFRLQLNLNRAQSNQQMAEKAGYANIEAATQLMTHPAVISAADQIFAFKGSSEEFTKLVQTTTRNLSPAQQMALHQLVIQKGKEPLQD